MADPTPADVAQTYTVLEIAGLLDVPARTLRVLVAEGIVHPCRTDRGKYRFSFTDLVVLRSIADLVHAGVKVARIRSAVAELRTQLPDDVDLSAASLDAHGRTVVASLDGTTWEPESGQTVLTFDVGDVRAEADRITLARPVGEPEGDDARAWSAWADAVEDDDPVAAEDAYRRSVAADPDHADAHLNLGRLLHAGGAVSDALDEYLAALALDPDDPTAAFNVGVAYDDLRDDTRAVDAYERALDLAPRFADAQFNLAAVYERMGRKDLAIRHLRAYRDLIDGR